MSKKQLIIIGVSLLVIVNGSIFGTLYLVELFRGPTAEEIAAQKEAELQAVKDAIYAGLEPVAEFKSKVNYIKSIGEAVGICENKLQDTVTQPKSWEVNMIESRYLREQELYKIFLLYQTASTATQESQLFKVLCEVSGETRIVELWKATPK